ncbi:MAG: hypothetical protein HY272_01835 [Gammaproteobacteria bacterium]|nr:hypothetical protein [Gammaproteobacteria bacterium]
MGVMGVCPDCGFKFTLDAALQDAHARQALAAALEIAPSLASRIVAYMGLFSPGCRAMRMDALAARLNELAAAIKAAEVQRDGRSWAAPLDYWREAIDHMLGTRDKLRLPLKDHGYLFAVVANMSMKAAGQKEQKIEQQRRVRPEGNRTGTPQPVDQAARRALADQHLAKIRGRKHSGEIS